MFNLILIFVIIFLVVSIILNFIFYQKRKSRLPITDLPFLEIPLANMLLNAVNSKDIKEIYRSMISSSKIIFNFSSCFIYLFNHERNYLVCKERFPSINLKKKYEKISMSDEKHFLVRVVLDNKPYIVPDILYDKRIQGELLISNTTNGLIAYPIKLFNFIEGVFLINFDNNAAFTEEQLAKLELIMLISQALIIGIKSNERMENVFSNFNKLEDDYKQEIKLMQEELLLSGKLSSLGVLASGIAHEIRNPLTVVKMLVNELFNSINNANYAEDIQVIKTEIDRMDEIVTQFLEFARPKELNKIKCNINRLLRETINFLEIELKNKNIMVKQNLYSTLPTTNCDNNLMKQVFINIILNAIDAIHCVGMDNGLLIIKTSVQIRKKRDGSATSFIKIAFEDNGTGIPTDMVNKLFDPFITSKEKGIGLGLSTSYRIIENHKGIIEAKNRVEGGARFIIYLPIE